MTITISLTETEVQLITKTLQEHALKLEEEDGDSEIIQKINNLAYIFQELQQDPKLRDKPQQQKPHG